MPVTAPCASLSTIPSAARVASSFDTDPGDTRAWLANIVEKGEVLKCEPGFTALDVKEGEAAKKAPAKAAAETEA